MLGAAFNSMTSQLRCFDQPAGRPGKSQNPGNRKPEQDARKPGQRSSRPFRMSPARLFLRRNWRRCLFGYPFGQRPVRLLPCWYFSVDEEKENAVLRAANSEGGQRMLARQHSLPVGKVGIVGYATGAGRPRIATDVGEDARIFNNPDLPDTRSEMALPLKVGEPGHRRAGYSKHPAK